MRLLISTLGGVPISSCSTSSGRAAAASSRNSSIGSVAGKVRLMTRLSIFSTLQQNSPISCAPTMRPLPLSVWNARRTDVNASLSSKLSRHAGRFRLMPAISSLASSMKSSTSSGSGRSSPACMTAGGSGSATGSSSAAGKSAATRVSASSATSSTGSSVSSVGSGAWRSSTSRQRSALSNIYQGSLRPADTVSM